MSLGDFLGCGVFFRFFGLGSHGMKITILHHHHHHLGGSVWFTFSKFCFKVFEVMAIFPGLHVLGKWWDPYPVINDYLDLDMTE